MIDAARNKIRVKACYLMMAATISACLMMVILGKRVSVCLRWIIAALVTLYCYTNHPRDLFSDKKRSPRHFNTSSRSLEVDLQDVGPSYC